MLKMNNFHKNINKSEYIKIMNELKDEDKKDFISEIIVCLNYQIIDACNTLCEICKINLIYLPNINECLEFLSLNKYKSITIVGLYKEFSHNNINNINLVAKKNNNSINIIMGENINTIMYSILKIFDKETLKVRAIQTIDSLLEKDIFNNEIDIIKSKFDKLIILAHGDGIHLKMQNYVICGVIDKEFNKKNKTINSGCSIESCRKINRDKKLIKANKIQTNSLYLLTCNGIAVNNELYDTNASLIDAFIKGYPKEILTTIRTQEISEVIKNVIYNLIVSEYNIGKICWILNDLELIQNNTLPYVVIGGGNNKYIGLNKLEIGQKYNIDNKLIECIGLDYKYSDKILSYNFIGKDDVEVIRGYSCLLIQEKNNSKFNGTIELTDSTQELYNIKNMINIFFNRVRNIDIFLKVLLTKVDNVDILNKLNNCKKYILSIKKEEKVIFNYLNNIFNNKIYNYKKLQIYLDFIKVKKENLQKILIQLFYESNINLYIESVLMDSTYKVQQDIANDLCWRCKSKLEKYIIMSSNCSIEKKEMIYCPICGINKISSIDFPCIMYVEENYKNINFIIDFSNKFSLFQKLGHLIFEITDKTENNIIVTAIDSIKKNKETIKINREKLKNVDLHSYKCTVVIDLEILYFHGRFQN